MRSTLRNAVVLIAVIAGGCKDEDDDDDTSWAFDSSVLPGFDAGVDAGRSDGGGFEAGLIDASAQLDTSVPPADTGTPGQDATTGDATAGDAGMDAGGDGGGVGDASSDASPSDAGGDARVGDGGPRDGGRDGATDAGGDAGTPATFTRVLAILRENCRVCHTDQSQAQLNFAGDAGYVYDSLIGVRASAQAECGGDPEHIRVMPNDPENSLLIQKLVDPPCGDRMPRFRDPLSPALINEIRSWIAAGAPEN